MESRSLIDPLAFEPDLAAMKPDKSPNDEKPETGPPYGLSHVPNPIEHVKYLFLILALDPMSLVSKDEMGILPVTKECDPDMRVALGVKDSIFKPIT